MESKKEKDPGKKRPEEEPRKRAEEKAGKPAPEKGEGPSAPEEKPEGGSPEGEELQKLRKELEAQKQQYLRVLAEYDNFRKRTQKEKDERYNDGMAKAAQEILPIADNIERALSQENVSAEDMRKGVEMIQNQIHSAFEKMNLQETGKEGEPFDPKFHNAVAHIDDEGLGENVISAVYQKGYLLGDRVVRHAMVQVAN